MVKCESVSGQEQVNNERGKMFQSEGGIFRNINKYLYSPPVIINK